MEVIKRTVWEAYTNSDTCEGRGHDVHIGYFTDEFEAKRATKNKGVMGTDAWVKIKEIEIKIFESYDEFNGDVIASKVNKLNLTPEQIEYIKHNM